MMNYNIVEEAREYAQWSKECEALSIYHELSKLEDRRATFPCAATYSNVLRAVDPEQVNQVLMDLVMRVRTKKRIEGEHSHVVLDGKTDAREPKTTRQRIKRKCIR